MEAVRLTMSLPVLKGDMHFVCKGTEIQFIVDGIECDNIKSIKFVRNQHRWRWVGGPFVSCRAIAARIFEYRDNPTTQECEWMEDCVDGIGRLIDAAYEAIKDARKEITQQLQTAEHPVVTDFFEDESVQQQEPTFVYLMRHANGLTKIGRSKNPRVRERTLQAEDPRLKMMFCCVADSSLETKLHLIFDSARVRGEWFDLMEHHVDWIIFLLRGINVEASEHCYI